MLTTSTGPNPVPNTPSWRSAQNRRRSQIEPTSCAFHFTFRLYLFKTSAGCRIMNARRKEHSTSTQSTWDTRQMQYRPTEFFHSFSCLCGLPCGLHNKCQIQFSGVRPGVRINYLGKLHFLRRPRAHRDLSLESLKLRLVSCPPRNAFVLIYLKVIKLNSTTSVVRVSD